MLLTIDDAAAKLRVSPRTIEREIGDGGPADATQEELIAEVLAEEALGGGFSYPPGRA
jgi:hypothetical protein